MAKKKLDEEQIQKIKELKTQGESISKLAKDFNVDRKTIYNHVYIQYGESNRKRALKYAREHRGTINCRKRAERHRIKNLAMNYRFGPTIKYGSLYQEYVRKDEERKKSTFKEE